MSHIQNLTNNNYQVLEYLYDKADKQNCVRITQSEVAKDFNLTRNTMNSIFKNLREFGYLVTDEEIATKHYLTNSAIKIVKIIKKIEE